MSSSPGENVKKGRKYFNKVKAAKQNLKNAVAASKGKGSRIDWLRLEQYKTNRLNGMNRYRAAKMAGYAETTARHNAGKYDRLAKIDILQALEDAGATNTIQAQQLFDMALNATKRQRCTVEVHHGDDGEVEIDDKAAEVVPDLSIRLAAWEHIAKLKNQLKQVPVVPIGDFKRMILVVENTDEPNTPAGSDDFNPAAKRGVEVTD